MPIQPLPERPLLKRHLLAAIVEPDEVFLLAEDHTQLWKNRALRQIVPYLDGTRSLSDLFDQLGSQVSPPEIIFLLNQLHELGLLAEGVVAGEMTGEEVALWHALGLVTATTPERLSETHVRLHRAGLHVDVPPLAEALARLGVRFADTGSTTLDIAVTDHYYRPELTQLNAAALSTGAAWMACKLSGQTLWIGPIFRPGHTGCLACLQDRLRLNRQVEDYVVRKTGDNTLYETSIAASPVLLRLGALWAAQEIALWLCGQTERLEGKLLSVSTPASGVEVAVHQLVRRPQCPVCGNPDAVPPQQPIVIRRQLAAHTVGAERRVEQPEVTWQRLQHHISPITGVVTWLTGPAQDHEGLLYSCMAGHNFVMGPDTLYWLQQSIRSRTGGKGTTAIQAKVSAVGEAIERYCGVFRGDEARIRASYRVLGEQVIHPYLCLLFSEQQYHQRDALNAANHEGSFHLIPNRFPDDLEIDWVTLWSLTQNESRYLPAAYCYYGHPDVERYFYCAGDSNGCAAGNALEEAILQAFLELVERDSAAIWWYNRLSRPGLDLDSFANPYVTRLRTHYQHRGRDLWALDLTTDTQIPVFAAISRRIGGPTEDLLIGLGAHLDPVLALLKAVTELNQFLPAVSRFDTRGNTLYSWPDDTAVRFWKHETLQSQTHLHPAIAIPPKTLADFPNLAGLDLFDNLQICLQAAHHQGLEVLVLDQSRPDIELNVVRVVVPGMRHFWRRLGPGRLYDVPVQLGWLDTPTPEDNLNPVSIFF